MAKKYNFAKGKAGERIAKLYLEKKGLRWIESNYTNKYGEIDLIMEDGDRLVFVEVKLKIGDKFGTPEEMIGPGKIWQVKQTATAYVMEKKPVFSGYRIDAVAIVVGEDKVVKRISHYANIG